MSQYIGLGCNQKNRMEQLKTAINHLSQIANLQQMSSIYETPALLPPDAPPEWNRPFLNMVAKVDFDGQPEELLQKLQEVEGIMGREAHEVWAPRLIDLDILLWDGLARQEKELVIPHSQIENRAFVMDPLSELLPEYCSKARRHPGHSPLWMSIVNLTPDSFSDGGLISSFETFESSLLEQVHAGVQIFDLGAESTRPGAKVLDALEEQERLLPYVRHFFKIFAGDKMRPKISVDTYHWETAEICGAWGVDIINDVSGLNSDPMLNVLKNCESQYVLTHSLGVPADPEQILKEQVVETVKSWFAEKINFMESQGIGSERIILDPGIGFGKNSLQSLEILKSMDQFQDLSNKILVGHSRKSFMNGFGAPDPAHRDLETIGMSLKLVEKGVDILRVHNTLDHIQALRGWSHVTS